MIENRLHGLDPIKLRYILSGGIVLIIILAGVGFWFFRSSLAGYARDVTKERQTAEASQKDLSALQKLKIELEEDSVAVNRAEKIVAETTYYKYQNQVIEDINTFAKASNVSIQGYAFDTGGTSGAASSAGATTSAPPSSSTVTGAPKTTSISITVMNPVKYTSLLQFIHYVEINLTKMQLSGISITKPSDSSSDTVEVAPIKIEVYVK